MGATFVTCLQSRTPSDRAYISASAGLIAGAFCTLLLQCTAHYRPSGLSPSSTQRYPAIFTRAFFVPPSGFLLLCETRDAAWAMSHLVPLARDLVGIGQSSFVAPPRPQFSSMRRSVRPQKSIAVSVSRKVLLVGIHTLSLLSLA